MNPKVIQKHSILFIGLFAYGIFLLVSPSIFEASANKSFHFLVEILKVLPPTLILTSLLEAWVSKTTIESKLGVGSGLRGSLLSVLMGTVSAGPLFGAFPIASSLQQKGVRTANTVIFICSWATIKIPLLVLESTFLGVHFAILRLAVTLPFILVIGYLMERILLKIK